MRNFPLKGVKFKVSYSSKGRKVRRRRKNLNIRNLIILIGGVIAAVLLFILLITGAVRLISKGIGAISGNGKDSSSQPNPSSSISDEIQPSSEPEEDQLSWSSVQMTEADEKQGDLILVNSLHEYRSEPEDLLIFYGNKSRSYGIKVAEMYAKSSVVSAMNDMMDAFSAATGNRSVLLNSAYRDVSSQQTLYNNDLASTGASTSSSVAAPGYSEHHTGYAVDLSYQSSSGYQYIDGTGDFSWLTANAYKYGFITRYTEDKSSITGIVSEPWHLRYVGTVHAEAIVKGGYCLEEYIDMLKLHDSENPYAFTSESGENYLIYYTENIGATTDIPIVSGKSYSISGTNEGGFVTVVPLNSSASASASTDSSDPSSDASTPSDDSSDTTTTSDTDSSSN